MMVSKSEFLILLLITILVNNHGRNLEMYYEGQIHNYTSNEKGIRGQGWTSSIARPGQNNFKRPQ
jgi:hypothetical protein